MKRTTKKLELKKDTIRILQGSELNDVVGGAPTAECTQQGTACSKTDNDCPLSHHNKPGHHGCQSGIGFGCQPTTTLP